jgi:hypothetical protein
VLYSPGVFPDAKTTASGEELDTYLNADIEDIMDAIA